MIHRLSLLSPPRRLFGVMVAAVSICAAFNLLAAAGNNDAAAAIEAAGATVQGVASPASALYPANRAPLAPSAFVKLPIGAITPKGWLRHQLELQRDGLNGRLEEVSPWLNFSKSSWTDPQGRGRFGWEEFPYWIKGYGDLGYVLGDQRIIANATRWLKAAMATQREDGYFGPRELLTALDGKPDMWPQMPVLNALQSYHEFSGDPQVIDVMTKYFKWQDSLPPEAFGAGYWPRVRMSDNLESIYWLYNRTGDAFLLGLADKIYGHSMQWNGIENWHNVNVAESFRTPTVFWEQARRPELLAGAERNYQQVMGKYGQFSGGGFAGDENAREGFYDPRQGFETCGMVEFMHSFEMLTKITGQPVWADRCEDVAFNSFPAAMTPDLKALHYLTGANMVQLDKNTKSPGLDNGGEMISYSPYEIYRCCQHNHGMGWPYYAEELWLGTPDGGLYASLYAASTVKAKVAGGKEVAIEETTDYPFKDSVTFTVVDAPEGGAVFPFRFRVPAWCDKPVLVGDGGLKWTTDESTPQVATLQTQSPLKKGDTFTFRFPMKVVVKKWERNKNAVSVNRGPLTYSLAIGSQTQPYGKLNTTWPETEVYATTPWNYGLDLGESASDPAAQFEVVENPGPVAAQPFTPETAPITIKAKARRIDAWTLDRKGLLNVLQPSPAKTREPVETVSLIPMGAARLRITSFPVASTAETAHEWTAPARPQAGLKGSASHVNGSDSTDALSDGQAGANSADQSVARFTWWDHRGTTEWVQYDFDGPRKLANASVYWFDDTGHGFCRVPASWRLLYKQGDQWQPVQIGPAAYTTRRDGFNNVTFSPVETTALRLEVQLQPGNSGGILEWKVE